jgi:hypothetical protein
VRRLAREPDETAKYRDEVRHMVPSSSVRGLVSASECPIGQGKACVLVCCGA